MIQGRSKRHEGKNKMKDRGEKRSGEKDKNGKKEAREEENKQGKQSKMF